MLLLGCAQKTQPILRIPDACSFSIFLLKSAFLTVDEYVSLCAIKAANRVKQRTMFHKRRRVALSFLQDLLHAVAVTIRHLLRKEKEEGSSHRILKDLNDLWISLSSGHALLVGLVGLLLVHGISALSLDLVDLCCSFAVLVCCSGFFQNIERLRVFFHCDISCIQ